MPDIAGKSPTLYTASELRAWLADLAEHPVALNQEWFPQNLPANTNWIEEFLTLDQTNHVPFWFLDAEACHPSTGDPLSASVRQAWLLWTLSFKLRAGLREASSDDRRRDIARILCFMSHDWQNVADWPFPEESELSDWL
jgi:hypothetical protein